MKNISAFLCLLFSAFISSAQLIPYNKSGIWGVVKENKEPVIPFQYREIDLRKDFIIARGEGFSDVYNFQGQKIQTIPGEYVYPVTIKGKPGLIMPLKDGVELRYLTGEVALKAGNYDYIRAVDKVFEVRKNKKYGLLDQNLKELFPPVYKEMHILDGWAVPFNGNTSRKIISSVTCKPVTCYLTVNRMEVYRNGYFYTDKLGFKGLVDTLCREIVPAKYKYIYVGEDLIHAQKLNDKHDLYLKNGQKLLKEEVLEYEKTPQYYLISTKGKTIFYNKHLKPLRETDFDQVKTTQKTGLFYARKGRKWGIIDSMANLVYPLRDEGYSEVYDGYALLGPRNYFYSNRFAGSEAGQDVVRDTINLMYPDGRKVSMIVQGRALGLTIANRQAVVRGNKIGFVDFKGREVIPFLFDYDAHYETMHYGAVRTFSFDPATKKAIMFLEGKDVVIDTTGTIIKDPKPESYVIREFGNGLKLVGTREPFRQVGILNEKGEFVLPLTSEPVQVLNNNFVAVGKGKRKALFDGNFRQVTGYKYEMFHDPRIPNLFYVLRNGKTGYIDYQGEEYFE